MSLNVLITGANRGLGLEFTRQYAQAGWQVFACCRHPDKAVVLQQLATTLPDLHRPGSRYDLPLLIKSITIQVRIADSSGELGCRF